MGYAECLRRVPNLGFLCQDNADMLIASALAAQLYLKAAILA